MVKKIAQSNTEKAKVMMTKVNEMVMKAKDMKTRAGHIMRGVPLIKTAVKGKIRVPKKSKLLIRPSRKMVKKMGFN